MTMIAPPGPFRGVCLALLLALVALVLTVSDLPAQTAADEQAGAPGEVGAPLPLEVVVSLRDHNGRSPVNVSPDGEWIAHTVETDETVPRGVSNAYADTGFPFAEGNARMEATLSRTDGTEAIRLGPADASSWAGVWAPDGSRVAFYSDEGGEAGLWIWDRASRERRRVGDFVVRPFFGFETVRWAADGERLLVKLLPEARTLAEANAMLPAPREEPPAAEPEPGEPSVTVRRSAAAERAADPSGDPGDDADEGDGAGSDRLEAYVRAHAVDLAVVDVETGSARRIVRGETVRLYRFSPDDLRVAYTVPTGLVPDTQQSLYDLRVHDLETGSDAVLAEDVPLRYGIEWGWSPDGRRLAYTRSGQVAEGEYVVVDVPAGDGALWALARDADGRRSGIYRVDPESGEIRPALQQERLYSHVFSQAASAATGDIFYVSRDQQEPSELWGLGTDTGESRRVSRINAELTRYALGRARLIHWRSLHGESLAGALLLPPDYAPGSRLPLVVWVYGGSRGSRSVGRFGFWGAMPAFNMHVLATRGYAVLFPDAPLRPGRITDDLVATVLPGVNAAVEQGYADPDRLAVMGQSFGALNTLALLTRTDRFRAAVISAAVQHPDLFADYLMGSTNTGYYEQGQGNMGGSIWERHDGYLQNSPLFDFPEIDTPLLIGQGDRDGDLVASDAIFAALERLDKSVELRLYRGEGHVIGRDANVLDFWRRRLEFLARHLDLTADGEGRVEAR